MLFPHPNRRLRCKCPAVSLLVLICSLAALASPPAAGPTIHLDYGRGHPSGNTALQFMYFIPLLSPEQVVIITNAGNDQFARITSWSSRTNGTEISTVCNLQFTGQGWQKDTFEHDATIRQHAQLLQSGKVLAHQLSAINVEGAGSGTVEIQGTLTNGQFQADEVRMIFNNRGQSSPVTIDLLDIQRVKGEYRYSNDTVARVNTLTFRRAAGEPKMEVTLDSIKAKNAGNSRWQDFLGAIKGAAANCFLPPLRVAPDGQQAMLAFGEALFAQQSNFTFPVATRLKGETGTPGI